MENEIVDDVTLTDFLITCFSGIFQGALKPVKKATTPGTLQYFSKSGDLTYLETRAGGTYRYKTDVSVLRGEANDHIWYMSVFTDINPHILKRIGLTPAELLLFLCDSRQIGFIETLDAIQKKEDFCLWDIPDHTAPAVVGKDGTPGNLSYAEGINDNLDLFRGEERIRFRPEQGSERSTLYTASFHGGRL